MTQTQLNKQNFSPSEMMAEAEKYALSKAHKSNGLIMGLAIMAGVFIGLAFLFYITVTTNGAETGWGLNRLAGGIAFSMGLILIVICGGELFTSSMLASISWANKQISFSKLLTIWGKVYVGNFIGAMLLLVIVSAAALYNLDGGQWGLNALNIAQHKLHHSPVQAFALGVLCNMLVCLAIWLTFSSANVLVKALMTVLPVSMFVSSGFEHCIANMFMVPLGIVIQQLAPDAFWLQIGTSASHYADLNIYQFITANLIPVTLGNIIGGALLVGLANWCIYRRPQLTAVSPVTAATTISTFSKINASKDITMNTNIAVKDVMNTNPVVLTAETSIAAAIDTLLNNKLVSAPVVDIESRLVGFFSSHDVMVNLWCQDYSAPAGQKVVDIMTTDVIAIEASEKLVNIAEFLCIDKEQLYPTTDMGIATQLTTLTLEERAKRMKVSKPHVLPVLESGKFVGVLTREHVLAALRQVYGERVSLVENEQDLATA